MARGVVAPAALLGGALLLVAPQAVPPGSALASSISYLYPSFGTNGVALLSPSSLSSQAESVAPVPACPSSGSCPYSGIQKDVAVGGYEGTGSNGGTDFAVAVVNPTTGALVSSFGGGLVTSSFGEAKGSTIEATGVAVYPPCPSAEPACPWLSEVGDVVVVGTNLVAGATSANVEVAAYSPTGSVVWQTSSVVPSGYQSESAPSVALDTTGTSPSGDVIVGGSVSLSGGYQQPLLAALTPAGAVDTTFGGAALGVETGDILATCGTTSYGESLTGVAVDSAGDILAAGSFLDGSGDFSILVARFLPDGLLDNRFGNAATGCADPTGQTGATTVGSDDLGSGVGIEPEAGSCTGQPACYDVLVAGTSVPSTGSSSIVVAAVDDTGTLAANFGGGLVTVPSSKNGSTATGISVQTLSGNATSVLVTGFAAGSTTSRGTATISRITPGGSVISAFGTSGTYTIPSSGNLDAEAFGVASLPNTLDFMVAGAFAGTTDTVTRFGLARIIGELVKVSASVSRDTAHLDTGYVTITLTPSTPAPESLSVAYTLSSPSGLTFSPSKGTVPLRANATSGSAKAVVYFPPLVGNGTIDVATTGVVSSGFSSITTPLSLAVTAASPFGAAPPPGYWMMTTTGGVYAFDVPFKGALTSLPPSPIVGLAESPTGSGYWLATASGGVYAFGVPFKGALTSKPVAPIVAIATDPATGGYWMFGKTGAVYAFDAPLFGEGTTSHLSAAVASAGAAPDGLGYWLALTNGAVYGFGPGAKYYGGASGSHPSAPIVSFAPDPHTGGYWLVTSKGVVYAFNAPNLGSATGQDVTCITPDPATSGYWLSIANGGVYSFGAKFYGSAAPDHPHGAVVTILGR